MKVRSSDIGKGFFHFERIWQMISIKLIKNKLMLAFHFTCVFWRHFITPAGKMFLTYKISYLPLS